MSAQFENLHPYVCQRIIGLFELLAKRHAKVIDKVQDPAAQATSDVGAECEDEAAEQVFHN